MIIINVHAHIRPSEDLEERIARYQAPDVRRVCLSGDNKKVKEALTRHPDLIIGMARIRLGIDCRDQVKAAHDEGFRGLKLINPPADYDSEDFFPVYEQAQEMEMPCLFHTGYVSRAIIPDQPPSGTRYMRPVYLDTIARHFPQLKIIGAHLGNPWFWEAISVALSFENAYFDLSGGTVRALPLPLFKSLFSYRTVEGMSAEDQAQLPFTEERVNQALFSKIVFGTDNPPTRCVLPFYLRLMEMLGINDDVRADVLGLNAARLFDLSLDELR